MVLIGSLEIDPPFLNSSSPWASDEAQLRALYQNNFTGAITTRTATLNGFDEDPKVHKVAFQKDSYTSINSYGYSPLPLKEYIAMILALDASSTLSKPVIISVTYAAPDEMQETWKIIDALRDAIDGLHNGRGHEIIGIELNTSCPNIDGMPPPSYNMEQFSPLLESIGRQFHITLQSGKKPLTMGIKLPPYVNSKQFEDVALALQNVAEYGGFGDAGGNGVQPISFLTCTNTLGSSVLFTSQIDPPSVDNNSDLQQFALPTVSGGLGGEAIHSISLGNVYAFSNLLAAHPYTAGIKIIGVGGVISPQAAQRMFKAGASAVAVATALGREGVDVFRRLQGK